jgi:Mg2+/Co2+ transporter CorB
VLEHLETIPETNVCLWAGDYQIETLQIKDNIVKTLSIRRQSKPESQSDSRQETEDTPHPVV